MEYARVDTSGEINSQQKRAGTVALTLAMLTFAFGSSSCDRTSDGTKAYEQQSKTDINFEAHQILRKWLDTKVQDGTVPKLQSDLERISRSLADDHKELKTIYPNPTSFGQKTPAEIKELSDKLHSVMSSRFADIQKNVEELRKAADCLSPVTTGLPPNSLTRDLITFVRSQSTSKEEEIRYQIVSDQLEAWSGSREHSPIQRIAYLLHSSANSLEVSCLRILEVTEHMDRDVRDNRLDDASAAYAYLWEVIVSTHFDVLGRDIAGAAQELSRLFSASESSSLLRSLERYQQQLDPQR